MSAGVIPWTLPGALLLLAAALLAYAIRLARFGKAERTVLFTATDVRLYVERRAREQYEFVQRELTNLVLEDESAPVLGADWQPYFDANWERLIERAGGKPRRTLSPERKLLLGIAVFLALTSALLFLGARCGGGLSDVVTGQVQP